MGTPVNCGDQSGLGHWWGAWVNVERHRTVSLQATWTLVAATAGELFLEGTDSPYGVSVTAGIALDSTGTRFANAAMRWFLNGALSTAPLTTAAVGVARIGVLTPMRYHRLAYQRSGGGGLAQFGVTAFLRGIE